MRISLDCHGIVAVLVISGKQPPSGLLHVLRFILFLCGRPPERLVLQYRVIFLTSWKHCCRVPGYPFARGTTSTNVEDINPSVTIC